MDLAQKIYHHPDLYRTLPDSLKESSQLAETALSFMPELIMEEETPSSIRHDARMIKTAFVASMVLGKKDLRDNILQQNPTLASFKDSFLRFSRAEEPNSPVPPEDSELWNIQPVVALLAKKRFDRLKYAAERFKSNVDLVLDAVPEIPDCLAYVNKALCNNADFMLEALRRSTCVYTYVGTRLRQDPSFIAALATLDKECSRLCRC